MIRYITVLQTYSKYSCALLPMDESLHFPNVFTADLLYRHIVRYFFTLPINFIKMRFLEIPKQLTTDSVHM